jgi:hypothetical protein
MYRIQNKHITEESVRQVGYLPELYEDARSEKYKTIGPIFKPEGGTERLYLNIGNRRPTYAV